MMKCPLCKRDSPDVETKKIKRVLVFMGFIIGFLLGYIVFLR